MDHCAKSTVLAALAGACFVAVLGCSDDEEARQNQLCKQICARLEDCTSLTDEPDCIAGCIADTHLSLAYFEQRASCLTMSCDMATNKDIVDDCIGDALAVAPTTEQQQRVCQAMSTKVPACSPEKSLDSVALRQGCLDGPARFMSQTYLEQSEECISLVCEEIDPCLEGLADGYNAGGVTITSTESPTD